MRVLHLSKYDAKGGAALAALNSMKSQRGAGIDARMFVGCRRDVDPFVDGPSGLDKLRAKAAFAIERLPFRMLGLPPADVRSLGLAGLNVLAAIERHDPDVVMLHNVDGLVPLAVLPRINRPIVWRMHDMWAASGSRHYMLQSGSTAESASAIVEKIDRWVTRRKQHIYRSIRDLAVCAPSHWMADVARNSALLGNREAFVIPNGIDTSFFRPGDTATARTALGISPDKPTILFGASGGTSDPRKGADLLFSALKTREADLRARDVQVLLYGGAAGPINTIGLPVRDIGRVASREDMRQAIHAADLAVVPSRMENLSLTVLEALACGVPVVAFAIGGMPDMIRNDRTGWLAPEMSAVSLGETIILALDRLARDTDHARLCREIATHEFSLEAESEAMIALFRSLVDDRRSRSDRAACLNETSPYDGTPRSFRHGNPE